MIFLIGMSALSARRRFLGSGLGHFGAFVHVGEAFGAGEAGAQDIFCGGLPADSSDALLAGSGAADVSGGEELGGRGRARARALSHLRCSARPRCRKRPLRILRARGGARGGSRGKGGARPGGALLNRFIPIS